MAVRIVGGGISPPLAQKDIVVEAAIAVARSFALTTAYQEELEAIFASRPPDPDKSRRARERLLASLNTLPVLQFIWKESPYVTAEALEAAGIQRLAHGGPLTVHGLTMLMHTGAASVGAAVKRVGNIVRAGQAYGLIQTHAIREKMIEIAGTEALHTFMLRVYVGQALRLPPPPENDNEGDDA